MILSADFDDKATKTMVRMRDIANISMVLSIPEVHSLSRSSSLVFFGLSFGVSMV